MFTAQSISSSKLIVGVLEEAMWTDANFDGPKI